MNNVFIPTLSYVQIIALAGFQTLQKIVTICLGLKMVLMVAL